MRGGLHSSSLALLLALVAWLAACRGSSAGAEAQAEPPRPVGAAAEEIAGDEGEVGGGSRGGLEERDEQAEGGEAAGDAEGERDEHWASFPEGTRCEGLCARVYECVLDEGREDEAGAASIELGCLRACVEGPRLGPFGACESRTGCGELLGCVRAAWPSQGDPPSPGVESPASGGCRRACDALASCYGASQDDADRCAERCGEVLPEESEAAIGECADEEDCEQIERCMKSFPGS